MPLQATSGAASYDAFGGGAAAKVNYIEDFFQSYLRTGTGASATVTTGLDGSTKETLVWTKSRSAATNHKLTDNVRGATKALSSNTTGAEATDSQGLTAFSATGYTLGTNTDYNNSGATYVDWQWIAQPKFFDVVTYTGNGTAGRTVTHNLGSVPGCMIVRPTSAVDDWFVYHRSLLNSQSLFLNLTAAASNTPSAWNSTTPTSTEFTVGTNTATNANGVSYVAYLFAHNAGGFGLTGTDNVISCGSFTTDGSGNATVSLGYEPQWVLVKRTNTVESWQIIDNMRGWPVTPVVGNYAKKLIPNSTAAEADTGEFPLTNTGFNATGIGASNTYIYIAIRRGPMKVPTSGTSVFTPLTYTNPGTGTTITSLSFPADVVFTERRDASAHRPVWDRLRGATKAIYTNLTGAEGTVTDGLTNFASNVGYTVVSDNAVDGSQVNYVFRRAPSFFDEVCYTGTGTSATLTHNLQAVPEMMIVKNRTGTGTNWNVYHSATGNNSRLFLNLTNAVETPANAWDYTTPTATNFYLSGNNQVNLSGNTYVAYLFATCAGVSKCTAFTGTGTLQTINCGFTAGSRFVLIKRTDAAGDWYVWDSSRGLSSSTDPYLLLNSTAAEVTSANWVDTTATGFQVTAASGNNVNINGASYIALAIA